jgi:hypothetical protein
MAATQSWAESPLDLASLLADPESYESQVVRVRGTVANHKIRRGVTKCFQSFTLTDEAGSIPAVHGASCAGAKNALRNRDLVIVEARFEWTPGRSGLLKVHSIVTKLAPSAQ